MGRLSVGARQLVLILLSSAALRTAKAKPLLEDHQKWLDCVASPATCTYLNLYNDLSGGTIPDAIGDLTALTYLNFFYNVLSGTIPDAIGGLTALTWLRLHNNKLTGAGAGICSIVGNSWQNAPNGGACSLSPNSAWTDGATCPTCLNTGACAPPVTCTGALTITPTTAPTTTPSTAHGQTPAPVRQPRRRKQAP